MKTSLQGARRHIALLLLFLVSTLNFMDRQLLSVLAEPIKRDMHLSDTQLGLLTGFAFALFYATFAVPIAALADRTHRVRLIAAACLVWSAFTAACGLATSFVFLAVSRIGVGIGEAGGTPPSLSILADYYPAHRRSLIIALFTVSGAFGVFLAGSLGGWAAHAWGWKAAFFCVAALGLVLAPLLLIFVREPVRGGADPHAHGAVMSFWETVRLFRSKPSLRWLTLASGLAAFVTIGMLSWTPAFMVRTQGMSMTEMGHWLGAASGLSMATGLLSGGLIVNLFATRSPRAYALVPAAALLVAAPLLCAAVMMTVPHLSLLLLIGPMTLGFVYTAPSLALIQNLVPPSSRATASAIVMLAINLVGTGGGPLFVGMISDAVEPRFGAESLRVALLCLVPACLLASLAFYALSRSVAKDLSDVAGPAVASPA